jgi:magnesium transporter
VVKITVPEDTLKILERLVEERDWENLREEAAGIHPHDLSEFVQRLEEELQDEVLTNLGHEILVELLPELPEEKQLKFVEIIPPKRAAELLRKIPSDEMVDMLKDLPRDIRRGVLGYFTKREVEEARKLLKHPPDTAGGLMTTEVLSFSQDITVQAAAEYIREKAREFETIYYVYVTDEQDKLVGVLSLRDLVLASSQEKLKDIMNPDVIKVPTSMDQEEVARITADYDLAAVPVVDEEDRLVGIVTVDDVIDIIEEEVVEDLGHLAGTGAEIDKLIEAPALRVATARLPWIIFALIGGLVAGSVIGAYEETLSSIVLLAIFIPVIMGIGGNVGIQSSTVFVRGIATGEIRDPLHYFLKEVKVGFIIGSLVGVSIAIIAQVWKGLPHLGFIVGSAMFLTITLACIIGVAIPKLFDKFGVDPAIASSPFVTTIQDIMGLFIYFGMATLMLRYLI